MTSTVSAPSLEEENLRLRKENIMLKELLDLSEKNLLQIAYMASGSGSRSSKSMKSDDKSIGKIYRSTYSRSMKSDFYLKTLSKKESKKEPSTNLKGKVALMDFEELPMEQIMPVESENISQGKRRSSRKKTFIINPLFNYE
jgi:hypothetical protein